MEIQNNYLEKKIDSKPQHMEDLTCHDLISKRLQAIQSIVFP